MKIVSERQKKTVHFPIRSLLLLNKLLEDGNALYRRDKLTEAAYRYEYALKKLPAAPDAAGEKGEGGKKEAPGGGGGRLELVLTRLRSHLLLNLSRTQRRLGNHRAAADRATQALAVAQAWPEAAPPSEALWTRARVSFEAAEEGAGPRAEGYRSALSDLREAVRLAPSNLQLHRFTGRVKERLAEAEKEEEDKVKEVAKNANAEEEGPAAEGCDTDAVEGKEVEEEDERAEADGCAAKAFEEGPIMVQGCC